jgi:hypothetical protein
MEDCVLYWLFQNVHIPWHRLLFVSLSSFVLPLIKSVYCINFYLCRLLLLFTTLTIVPHISNISFLFLSFVIYSFFVCVFQYQEVKQISYNGNICRREYDYLTFPRCSITKGYMSRFQLRSHVYQIKSNPFISLFCVCLFFGCFLWLLLLFCSDV